MPFITVDLLRRRAEHNDGCLRDLKEVTLHQQDLERIDVLNDECKELEILYLQNNLIGRIENLFRLKRLWYLNLAINNIQVIENLELLESLKKLDLTLNFIADLTSIQNLQANAALRQLHLTGNGCTKVEGYRHYVIDVLPQLESLDFEDVTPTERIRARQESQRVRAEVEEQRLRIRAEGERRQREREAEGDRPRPVDEKGEKLYGHTPEDRLAAYHDTQARLEEGKSTEARRFPPLADPAPAAPLTPEQELEKYGRYLQRNQAGLKYELTDTGSAVELLVGVPKFISTSLIECDVQPTYVRLTIKGKVLQLTLPQEVAPDRATVGRGQVDGRLKVTMPFAEETLRRAASPKALSDTDPARSDGPRTKGFTPSTW